MVLRSLAILFFLLYTTYTFGISTLQHDGYIIKFKSKEAMETSLILDFHNYNQPTETRPIKGFNMVVVKELPLNFLETTEIEYIEPNYIYHKMDVPSDPRYRNQWGLKKIKAAKAWDIEKGSKEIIVAVIDTGVDYTHEDLKNNMWINEAEKNGVEGVDDDGNGEIDDIYGYDYANTDSDPIDDHNHGTHCSGIIGASHNSIGVAGVNANVKIMALKFLTAEGSGTLENALKSIKYGVDNGAKILSNSWGGGGFSQSLKNIIIYAKNKGVLFVAASGNEQNDNDAHPSYPASYEIDNIISVMATDKNDRKASFSNYGKNVHIAAPGVNILSTVRGNGYVEYSGTSMATPFVSGAAALMLAYQDMDYLSLKNRIIKTSDFVSGIEDTTYSGGRLNLQNLLLGIEPERPLPPDETKWESIEYKFESPHPYENGKTFSHEIDIPQGSKFFRLHFEKMDTEAKYDKIYIVAGSKEISLDGTKENFFSKHIFVENVDKVVVKLTSDYSVVKWGYSLDFYQIQ